MASDIASSPLAQLGWNTRRPAVSRDGGGESDAVLRAVQGGLLAGGMEVLDRGSWTDYTPPMPYYR